MIICINHFLGGSFIIWFLSFLIIFQSHFFNATSFFGFLSRRFRIFSNISEGCFRSSTTSCLNQKRRCFIFILLFLSFLSLTFSEKRFLSVLFIFRTDITSTATTLLNLFLSFFWFWTSFQPITFWFLFKYLDKSWIQNVFLWFPSTVLGAPTLPFD